MCDASSFARWLRKAAVRTLNPRVHGGGNARRYGHKIFPLPLGIPTHTDINTIPDSNGDSTEDPLALERRIMAARTQVKLPRLLIIGAPEKDGPEDTYCRSNWGYAIRCQYFRALRGLPDVDMLSRVPFSEYIETVASYAYVLSPPGNGFDCFRTWEALAVGTIPIVHNHSEYDARLFESTDSWVVSSPEEAAIGLAGRLARPERQIADKLEPWSAPPPPTLAYHSCLKYWAAHPAAHKPQFAWARPRFQMFHAQMRSSPLLTSCGVH